MRRDQIVLPSFAASSNAAPSAMQPLGHAKPVCGDWHACPGLRRTVSCQQSNSGTASPWLRPSLRTRRLRRPFGMGMWYSRVHLSLLNKSLMG